MSIFHSVILYSSLFLVITSLIPFIRNDYWIFRVFEYPRLQKLVLNFILLALTIAFPVEKGSFEYIIITVLTVNLIYLLYLVLPFTPVLGKQIVATQKHDRNNSIRLLIANVYQDNRRAVAYHRLIEKCQPDVVLMVETNSWWKAQMDSITDTYPYQISAPLENTYGMILYSRLPLKDESINFLVEDDIPSIEVDVQLRSGQLVKLHCVHPEPPVPQENPRSTERDAELLLVAKKAKKSKLPVIVAGDLNDVAWSYTTELFSKISGLLDPRRGRGFTIALMQSISF